MTQTPQIAHGVVSNVQHNKIMMREGQIQAQGANSTIATALTQSSNHTSPTNNFLKSLDKHQHNMQIVKSQRSKPNQTSRPQETSIPNMRVNNQIQKSPLQQPTHIAQSQENRTGSRDSNGSDFHMSPGSHAHLAQSYSHFTLNNMQTNSNNQQKTPFYSPKNVSGGLHHILHQPHPRPGTTLGTHQGISSSSKTNLSKHIGTKKINLQGTTSKSKVNETGDSTLNQSHSRAKLQGTVPLDPRFTTTSVNQQHPEHSTMMAFSPQSIGGTTTGHYKTPSTQATGIKKGHPTHQTLLSPTSQTGYGSIISTQQPLRTQHKPLQHHHQQQQQQTQESFKSTFVNFRASMKEEVHAHRPKVCTGKKSPVVSPSKLFFYLKDTGKLLNQTMNRQIIDYQVQQRIYENYINDQIEEQKQEQEEEEKIGQSTNKMQYSYSRKGLNTALSQANLRITQQLPQSSDKKQKQSPRGVQLQQTAQKTGRLGQNLISPNKVTTKKSPRNQSSQLTPEEQLWLAAETGNLAQISHLILAGVDVDTSNPNDDGWTALHYASHEGLDQVVEQLIRKFNADVNKMTANGRTALHIASTQQHKAVIERLLLAGANANVKSRLDGNTPMHILARFSGSQQNSDLIKLLLPFSQESLGIRNKNGFMPYELTPYQSIRDLLKPKPLENTASQKSLQVTHIIQHNQMRNIKVNNVEQNDVKAMFNLMNQQMKAQKPCNQPAGEHDTDDLLFESASSQIMQSFDTNNNRGQQQHNAPQKGDQLYTTGMSNESSLADRLLSFDTQSQKHVNQPQVLSPKNPGPKIAQIRGQNSPGQNSSAFNPSSAQRNGKQAVNMSEQRSKHQAQDTQQGYVPPQESGQLLKSVSRRDLNPGKSQSNLRKEQSPAIENQEKIGPDQFVAHQLLGTGSFGEVYLVEKLSNKQLYAMKVLTKSKIRSQNLIKYALTERNVMSVMQHPFIVRLRYAFQTQDKLFLICDYCPGGDLSQYLEIERQFSEEKAKFYIQEILLALEALHERDIIFRDLKPDNIVLDEEGHALLTDFGLSKEGVQYQNGGAKSFCGSYAYLAPEMIKKVGHGKAVDWYLLGVVFYEMLTGMPPYYADEKEILFQNIMNNTLEIPDHVTPLCQDLLSKLLNKNPLKRLGSKHGAEEVKAHPYFRETDWQVVLERRIKAPEPYLAEYAKSIIQVSPYMAAGHPKTRGKMIMKDHPQYIQGWSFAECSSKRSSSNEKNAWYVSSLVGKAADDKLKESQALQGGLWVNPPQISIPNDSEDNARTD